MNRASSAVADIVINIALPDRRVGLGGPAVARRRVQPAYAYRTVAGTRCLNASAAKLRGRRGQPYLSRSSDFRNFSAF
jgi:hypothetical protein